jgi:hypothetical protein
MVTDRNLVWLVKLMKRILGIFAITQDSNGMANCLVLITLDEMTKRLLSLFLTVSYRSVVIHHSSLL